MLTKVFSLFLCSPEWDGGWGGTTHKHQIPDITDVGEVFRSHTPIFVIVFIFHVRFSFV